LKATVLLEQGKIMPSPDFQQIIDIPSDLRHQLKLSGS
jgi:hypothetical protein